MQEKHRKQNTFRHVCLYLVFIIPHAVNAEGRRNEGQRAMMEIISPDTAPSGERPSELGTDFLSTIAKLFHGIFARVGASQVTKGVLLHIPSCEDDDQEFVESIPNEDWIGILHLPPPLSGNESTANGSECLLVLDRVKKAMLFGASAIIILTMNPNILKELDIAQLFSCPVVIVEDVGNITVLLKLIKSGLKIRMKITYGPSYDENKFYQTFTVWSPCWRARPGSGVVCMSDSRLSKVNPSLFWSYFYSALAVVMLLLLIKTNQRQYDGVEDDFEEETTGVAWHTLSSMKIKRYKAVCKYDDSERDTCAICLDHFCRRQKIRILPCIHEFHTKCIDPWLLRHPICPLCKLNVLEAKHFGGFLHNSSALVSTW